MQERSGRDTLETPQSRTYRKPINASASFAKRYQPIPNRSILMAGGIPLVRTFERYLRHPLSSIVRFAHFVRVVIMNGPALFLALIGGLMIAHGC
ncbi:hypothetical protein ACNJYD_10040 [Bradyrhizobium sp. DASA03005]|uniref:hypothetical protein n=1 Tax=Bradyrhizobium sp. SPXBL-02 TaxID=3395912 RepID=UPI003F707E22